MLWHLFLSSSEPLALACIFWSWSHPPSCRVLPFLTMMCPLRPLTTLLPPLAIHPTLSVLPVCACVLHVHGRAGGVSERWGCKARGLSGGQGLKYICRYSKHVRVDYLCTYLENLDTKKLVSLHLGVYYIVPARKYLGSN